MNLFVNLRSSRICACNLAVALLSISTAGCHDATPMMMGNGDAVDAADGSFSENALAVGQKLAIGSACSSDGDCGSSPFGCILEHPGGYCTRSCDIAHKDADCPSEAICQFDGQVGECHKTCNAQGDCRSSYICAPAENSADSVASHAFCDMADMANDSDGMGDGNPMGDAMGTTDGMGMNDVMKMSDSKGMMDGM